VGRLAGPRDGGVGAGDHLCPARARRSSAVAGRARGAWEVRRLGRGHVPYFVHPGAAPWTFAALEPVNLHRARRRRRETGSMPRPKSAAPAASPSSRRRAESSTAPACAAPAPICAPQRRPFPLPRSGAGTGPSPAPPHQRSRHLASGPDTGPGDLPTCSGWPHVEVVSREKAVVRGYTTTSCVGRRRPVIAFAAGAGHPEIAPEREKVPAARRPRPNGGIAGGG